MSITVYQLVEQHDTGNEHYRFFCFLIPDGADPLPEAKLAIREERDASTVQGEEPDPTDAEIDALTWEELEQDGWDTQEIILFEREGA